MDPLATAFVEACIEAYASGGWFALLSPVVLFGIRFYRLDQVERRLPVWARWSSWPKWGQWLALFLSAAVAAVITALVGGIGLKAAVVAAIPIALGALGGHKTTKAIGKKVAPPKPNSSRSLVMDIATGKLRAGIERGSGGGLVNPYSS
jgi:hypothetical protein